MREKIHTYALCIVAIDNKDYAFAAFVVVTPQMPNLPNVVNVEEKTFPEPTLA